MDCIPQMNRHRWRYSPGTSGIGRPSHTWAFQRSETTQMNIKLAWFPLYWLYLSIHNYSVLDSCGIPWSSGTHTALQLLNSWESIQGSSRTTCPLRNNLARPAAKCSSGHSLRTCWCEIPLAIPLYPTDVFPGSMKNWSNLLGLRVCSVVGLGHGWYHGSLSFIRLKTIFTFACFCQF